MGSLMAGWNSPRSKKRFERNLSLTKDEIDSYWRHKRAEQSSPQASVAVPKLNLEAKKIQKSSTFTTQDDNMASECARIFQLSPHKEILKSKTFNGREAEVEVDPEVLVTASPPAGWWTKTDLAFLNERPVLESGAGKSSTFKYEAQFNLTRPLKVDGESHASASSSTLVF